MRPLFKILRDHDRRTRTKIHAHTPKQQTPYISRGHTSTRQITRHRETSCSCLDMCTRAMWRPQPPHTHTNTRWSTLVAMAPNAHHPMPRRSSGQSSGTCTSPASMCSLTLTLTRTGTGTSTGTHGTAPHARDPLPHTAPLHAQAETPAYLCWAPAWCGLSPARKAEFIVG